jgi:hypothetical protein
VNPPRPGLDGKWVPSTPAGQVATAAVKKWYVVDVRRTWTRQLLPGASRTWNDPGAGSRREILRCEEIVHHVASLYPQELEAYKQRALNAPLPDGSWRITIAGIRGPLDAQPTVPRTEPTCRTETCPATGDCK